MKELFFMKFLFRVIRATVISKNRMNMKRFDHADKKLLKFK